MKAILTYHSIDSSGSPISVDEGTFRAHIAWLAAGQCRVVSLEELLHLPDDAAAVSLTFDDGFQNFADIAWPLLREHGLAATVFVVSDHVGRDNAWSSAKPTSVPILPLMNWDTLGQVADQGVTLGSHTRTHPDLRLSSISSLTDEIVGAAARIRAETGRQPKAFAYPYGSFSRAAIAQVGATHSLACTTELRALRAGDDPLQLPRFDAYYFRRTGVLESWGSGAFRRYVWLRASGRFVRRALELTRVW
jgi:peptidoglycan/xylan/chitin deacetylase (PgdA/CDA1 family)